MNDGAGAGAFVPALGDIARIRPLIRSGTLRRLRPRAWAVLLVVATERRPKLVQIQAATGFSRATVKRAIADLRAAGIVADRGSPLTLAH